MNYQSGGSEEYGNGSISGCSIPGPGACITAGHGCNSACWPQSCKISKMSENEDNITMLDSVYYGGGCFGCFGCEQSKKSCYTGCGKVEGNGNISGGGTYSGCFYGKIDASKRSEKVFGCGNGCAGCVETEGEFGQYVHIIEEIGGIN